MIIDSSFIYPPVNHEVNSDLYKVYIGNFELEELVETELNSFNIGLENKTLRDVLYIVLRSQILFNYINSSKFKVLFNVDSNRSNSRFIFIDTLNRPVNFIEILLTQTDLNVKKQEILFKMDQVRDYLGDNFKLKMSTNDITVDGFFTSDKIFISLNDFLNKFDITVDSNCYYTVHLKKDNLIIKKFNIVEIIDSAIKNLDPKATINDLLVSFSCDILISNLDVIIY